LIHRGRRPPSASPIDNDASIVLVPLIVAHVARVPPLKVEFPAKRHARRC
jgi:hypothetical protein